jgi:DNA-directed RNA polymerase subunit F
MQSISPAYFADIRTILYNRLPHLSDDDIDILIDIFLTTH